MMLIEMSNGRPQPSFTTLWNVSRDRYFSSFFVFSSALTLLVHEKIFSRKKKVTTIFVIVVCLSVCLSVCLYVCLSVCLSVCPEHSSVGFDPILIKFWWEVYILIQLCFPENGRGAPIMGGATPKKTCVFRGQPISICIFSLGVCRIWQGFRYLVSPMAPAQPHGARFFIFVPRSRRSRSQGHELRKLRILT